jgi:putative transcriptional regulator
MARTNTGDGAMKARLPLLGILVAILGTLALAGSHAARSQERDDSIILVAKRQLNDQIYGSTILLVKPLGEDRHVGFIINKPTQLTLGKLFPNHPPSQKVTSPVYLGGPFNSQVIFAMVQRHDSPGGRSVRIAPDLYLAIDGQVVDRIIETDAEHARFFAGMVLWKPGELADEMKRGLWYTLDARSDIVLRKADGLWEDLVGRSERKANTI